MPSELEQMSCPVTGTSRDERKSAQLAAQRLRAEPGVEVIESFGFAREILRSPKVRQDGAGADQVDVGNPEHVPVFYLDSEAHHRRLGKHQFAKYSSPQIGDQSR